MNLTASAGRKDRGDISITIERDHQPGVRVHLESSVERLYGKRITDVVMRAVSELGLDGVTIRVDDQGALDWVIMARVEAAVRRFDQSITRAVLPPMLPENIYEVHRDRQRRSRLYVPGNNPYLMINTGLFKPDAVILDLEDAVAPAEKDAARILVRNALRALEWFGVERMVRINPAPMGLDELEEIIPQHVHTVLVPKCESAGQINEISVYIERIRRTIALPAPVFLMPILESALGVERAFEIAGASEDIVALAFGAEDFTRDIGAARTREGKETFVARSRIVMAARAAGIQPIDTVFADVEDEEGLRMSALEARALGFEGKGCIHPGQIPIVHEGLRPSIDEVGYALAVKEAMDLADKEGLGVVTLGTKMIDPPVVARALRIIKLTELYDRKLYQPAPDDYRWALEAVAAEKEALEKEEKEVRLQDQTLTADDVARAKGIIRLAATFGEPKEAL